MWSGAPRTGRPARLGREPRVAARAGRGSAETARQQAVILAEQFLIDTCEAVSPDLPAAVLMDYLTDYRAHLATVVAASRGRARGRLRDVLRWRVGARRPPPGHGPSGR